MRYSVGVDGGASKTHALLIDETGCAVGFGKAGPSNHQVLGLNAAVHEIKTAIQGAYEDAGVPFGETEHAYLCLGGADLPIDYETLYKGLGNQNLAHAITIKNDTIAALRAGISRPWGVALICGTGFNAAARGPDGQEIVLPG